MVAQVPLGERDVDLPLARLQDLLRADPAGVGAQRRVVQLELRLLGGELRVDREVGAREVAVLRPLEGHVLEAQLEPGDLAGVRVGHEPGVRVAAVVALPHDAVEVVDGGRVLHGLSRAGELGDPGRVEALEAGDRRLGDHEAGGVDPEVVAAVDEAGHAVHEDAVPGGRADVEDDVPAGAFEVPGPVVVRDDRPAVPGVAAGGHEGAALVGGAGAAVRVQLGGVVAELDAGVQGDHVPEVDTSSRRRGAVGDPLQLLAVLGVHAGPEDRLRGLAEEGPVALAVVGERELRHRDRVLYLRGEERPVLEAHRGGRALQADGDPAVAGPARGAPEPRVLGGTGDRSTAGEKDGCGQDRG